MTRLLSWSLWGLVLAGCGGEEPAPVEVEEPERPNILLFTLDTTRYDVLGVYGSDAGATPNIDALAASSARFSRAYTVTPLTIPAHSSLFTSMWPPRHGVQDNGDCFLEEGAVTLAEQLRGAGYATMASVGAEVTSHHWGFAQGFGAYYDDMGENAQEAGGRWRVERRGDEVVADAMSWFDEHAAGPEPWFSWIHLFDPHAPYDAPEEWKARFPQRPYIAEVAFTDSLVQRVLDGLSAAGELDDTWVVVMADHGEGLGGHGEVMHGVLLYDSTTRVPLIIRPPGGLDSPRVLDFPVSVVDVMPTLLSAAGVELPTGMDGVDLTPWLGPEVSAPPTGRQVFVESLFGYRHYGWAPQKALVDDTHKLIDSTTPELYHRSDRAEGADLAPDEPELIGAMRGRLVEMTTAMVVDEEASGRAENNAERMAMLEALGYVTATAEPVSTDEVLPDPVDKLPVLRGMEEARQSLRRGELDEARKQVEGVLVESPGLVEGEMVLARVLMAQGEDEAAIALMRDLDDRHPSANAKAVLGTFLLQTQQVPQALRSLSDAIDSDPYLASAWVTYLHTLYRVQDFATLQERAGQAYALLPEDPVIMGMMGVTHTMAGELELAEPLLTEALRRDPAQPFVNYSLGALYHTQGDADRAEQFWLDEARLHPTSTLARRMLVTLYAEQKRYQEQVIQLHLILRHEPPSPMVLHSLAQAFYNHGEYREAGVAVERCLALAPTHPPCAMLKANVLHKLGDEEGAQAAYETALELGREAVENPPPRPSPMQHF